MCCFLVFVSEAAIRYDPTTCKSDLLPWVAFPLQRIMENLPISYQDCRYTNTFEGFEQRMWIIHGVCFCTNHLCFFPELIWKFWQDTSSRSAAFINWDKINWFIWANHIDWKDWLQNHSPTAMFAVWSCWRAVRPARQTYPSREYPETVKLSQVFWDGCVIS